jgi:CBS domain-containing protein
MGLLTIIGLCVLGGILGAWVFQKLHVPQVVGYIVIGVLIGDSGFQVVSPADILALRPFNLFALRRAGEIGKNITEADVTESLCVGDVMNADIDPIPEDLPLSAVFALFTQRDALVYPVVSITGRIHGIITFDSLKDLLADAGSWPWLVAGDVMEPVKDRVTEKMNLSEALDRMNLAQLEAVPVFGDEGADEAVGIFDLRYARRRVREEFIRRTAAARCV